MAPSANHTPRRSTRVQRLAATPFAPSASRSAPTSLPDREIALHGRQVEFAARAVGARTRLMEVDQASHVRPFTAVDDDLPVHVATGCLVLERHPPGTAAGADRDVLDRAPERDGAAAADRPGRG